VSLLGGHTVRDPELKFGYAVTGVVDRRRMFTNARARVGDRLLLTKPLGTGVLATALKHGRLEPGLVRRLTAQMTTLNRTASELAARHGVRAATDVTGFGLMDTRRRWRAQAASRSRCARAPTGCCPACSNSPMRRDRGWRAPQSQLLRRRRRSRCGVRDAGHRVVRIRRPRAACCWRRRPGAPLH